MESKAYGKSSDRLEICIGITIYNNGNTSQVRLKYDDNDEDKQQQVPNTREAIINDLEKEPYDKAFEIYYSSGFTYFEHVIVGYLGDLGKNPTE